MHSGVLPAGSRSPGELPGDFFVQWPKDEMCNDRSKLYGVCRVRFKNSGEALQCKYDIFVEGEGVPGELHASGTSHWLQVWLRVRTLVSGLGGFLILPENRRRISCMVQLRE